jgi:uncharacterized protein
VGAYLVRFHEAGRDGQAVRRGQRRDLVQEIERALPGAAVTAEGGRILVECEQDAGPVLSSLPGVTSFSPCRRLAVGDAEAAAVELARSALPAGGRFAVRVKRVGQHRFRSRELAGAIGQAVGRALPGAVVDLAAPDLVIGVEVRGDDCYLFRDVVRGADHRRAAPPPAAGEPRFLADQMLGRLAVWLRLLGFDTAEARDRPDSWLLRQARDEGRTVLTQDRELSRAASASTHYVQARDVEGQLGEVMGAFGLTFDRARLLSRCTRCNRGLEQVAAERVQGRVPAAVRERQRRFYRCPACDRVYWEGDHCRRILARVSTLRARGVIA